MAYAGFDVSRCPPMSAMQWLWDHTNLYWVGFYLPVSGPGYQEKLSWNGKFNALRTMGWGVAPIYVGKQRNSAKLRSKAGSERLDGFMDGMEASNLARAERIPLNTVIYFDYEGGDAPTAAWKAYYYGWCEAVVGQLYYPGLYVSHVIAKPAFIDEIAFNTGPWGIFRRPEIWGINIDIVKKNSVVFDTTDPEKPVHFPEDSPSKCGAAEASSWQHSYYCTIRWMDHSNPNRPVKQTMSPVDLDTSLYMDPGQAVA
jgi:hypothetical protein